MKVKELDSELYAIVKENYWLKYGVDAYVERVCYDLYEARYVCNSLERCDEISFVIIKGGKRVI